MGKLHAREVRSPPRMSALHPMTVAPIDEHACHRRRAAIGNVPRYRWLFTVVPYDRKVSGASNRN